MGLSKERKQWYFDRLEELINTYSKLFIVSADNVGSAQMQQIRMKLRDSNSVMLMGKNTMVRKVITNYLESNPGHPFAAILPMVKGNIGFVFTNGDLSQVRDDLLENRVPAPARVGALAPIDVVVPPGPTDCEPGMTNFFQTLQIATKIVKGRIEITTAVDLLKAGDKVGSSEAVLLQKLGIRPFSYGLVLEAIYDNGSVFTPEVLDITPEILSAKFAMAVSNVAALSLAVGYPTLASVPHSIINAFKTCVAVSVECPTYTFEKAKPYQEFLDANLPKEAPADAAAPAEEKKEEAPAAPAPAAAKSDY